MSWLFEIAVDLVAGVFGYQVGRGKPGWVEGVTYCGCLAVIAIPFALLWLICAD